MKQEVLTIEQVRTATGVEAFEVDQKGRIRLPWGMSTEEKLKALKSAYRYYRRSDTVWRFLLGNMVNDLRLPHGEKRAYCIQQFGGQAGLTVYGYAWIAGHWQDVTQEFAWSWGFYKECANMPDDEKRALMLRYRQGKFSLDTCKAYCKEYRERAKNSPGISSPTRAGNSTINTTTTNVEFSVVVQSIRYATTRADALAYKDAADQRLLDFDCEEDTDRFAEE